MSEKTCTKCGLVKPVSDYAKHPKTSDGLYGACKPCVAAQKHAYYMANREDFNAKSRAYHEANREALTAHKRAKYRRDKEAGALKPRTWSKENPGRASEYFREYAQRPGVQERKRENSRRFREKPETRAKRWRWLLKLKLEVFNHYGGAVCYCCGEIELGLLTLDHINDDGAEHRRTVGSKNMYLWAKQNDFPDIFRVACFNCNCGRHHTGLGVCPHLLTRQELTRIREVPSAHQAP